MRSVDIADQKAVFATIESANVVPARARIAGTIVALSARWGDRVDQGQVIATVGDPKLTLQINSSAALVAAAEAQLAQAKVEFERAQRLIGQGAISRNQFDQSRTAFNVAQSNVRSLGAQRAVISQQKSEGAVLAPTAGRVITVPVTAGSVVMPGDTVATVAEQNFVLRLQIPESHARYLKVGDDVRLDGGDLGLDGSGHGRITLVYPQVDSGHVVADASVAGLQDYFVGQRVRVWISAGARQSIVVPSRLVFTRSGIDYVRLWTASDGTFDVPVQRGSALRRPQMPDGLEILSGLNARRPVAHAMNLGLSGRLTRATINSPLTPLFLLAAIVFGLVALMTIPREEEPQISVPMVDIIVQADGLKAADAAELVTKPLEEIVKGINGVEHVYSQTQDDRVMVTARFFVGTSEDDAILRVQAKIRANYDRIPIGIPEPLIVGRGINDVAIVTLTLSPKPESPTRWTEKDLYTLADRLRRR